jgi:antitoxin ParD1/3/4
MPNVHLTPQMQEFAEREISTGAFANLSEVVRAGMRKLMEERGAAAFHTLKADLNAAADELERGGGALFDPHAWEPEAFE